jgi:hypothetical protein
MTGEAQERVEALLRERWGTQAYIDPQPDGSLVIDVTTADGHLLFEINDERSPTLWIFGGDCHRCNCSTSQWNGVHTRTMAIDSTTKQPVGYPLSVRHAAVRASRASGIT